MGTEKLKDAYTKLFSKNKESLDYRNRIVKEIALIAKRIINQTHH